MKSKTVTEKTERGLLLPCLFAVLLFAVLIFCAPQAEAASTIASGNCGAYGNVWWLLDSDGVLTISGSGPMTDYQTGGAPWCSYEYKSSVRSVVIQYGVTTVGNDAFCACSNLTSVSIADSVTSIGSYAFSQCNNLTRVTIPNSVGTIASCAFESCGNLSQVSLPGSVTTIGSSAFRNCKSLTRVTLPNSVTRLGGDAFANCKGLTSLTIPESMTVISSGAFQGCEGLTSVIIPETVKTIESFAFRSCSNLATVKIMNPNCKLGLAVFSRTPVTVHGFKDSTAQKYAETNRLSFEEIHVHAFDSAVMERKATRKEDGKQWRTCVCGEIQTISTTPKITTVKLEKTSYTCDSKVKTPKVIVKDRVGNTLQKNTDYKVKYASGRKECGTYKVTVTFIGNYSGKMTLTFKIIPAKVTGLKQVKGSGTRIVWSKTAGATYYEIYYKDKGMKKFHIVEKTAGKPLYKKYGDEKLYHSNIAKGTVMQVKVRAVYKNADGTKMKGAFSKVLTAKAQ